MRYRLSMPCLILAALCLSACATPSTQLESKRLLTVPEMLKVPCEKPELLATGTVAELAFVAVEDARKLIECRNRHLAIVKIIEAYEDAVQ